MLIGGGCRQILLFAIVTLFSLIISCIFIIPINKRTENYFRKVSEEEIMYLNKNTYEKENKKK